MILTVVDWILRAFNFFVNIRLFFAIRRSGQAMKIYVLIVIYFITLHDMLVGFVGILHDIPSYFLDDSILANLPLLYGICVLFYSLQWFFQLLFLPVFSLIHFSALFFPGAFRKINTRTIVYIIVLLYILTAMLTAPLFTPYVAFIYHTDGKYWSNDYTKPYDPIFSAVNNCIQGFCLTVMVTCNALIIFKLFLYRKKHSTVNAVLVVSTTRGSGLDHTSTDTSVHKRKFIISPEARLAVSYIHLSGCFFASTLSYNFIIGTKNSFLAIVYVITYHMNSFKWILYCLGNKKIRRTFFSLRNTYNCS